VRTEQVKSFLKFFKPSIILDITPIVDVYGPTSWDPNIQALVVSKETISGAETSMSCLLFRTITKIELSSVTSHRQKHNLPPLQVFLIDVISATHASLDHEDVAWLKDNKLSSTFIRQWIVDHDKQKEGEEQRSGAV
jgi:phosphopantetheine adenylyltransferase